MAYPMSKEQAAHFNRCANALELMVSNRKTLDQKTVAERKWRSGLKPDKPQQACDVGLFSDDSKQTELLF